MRTILGCKELVMLTIFLVVIGGTITPRAEAHDIVSNAEPANMQAEIGGTNRDQEEKRKPTMAGVHTIDIEQLIKSLTTEQDQGCSRSEGGELRIDRPLIYRTNENLRNKHTNAYEPIMLSMGPYNHGTPRTHAKQVKKYELLVRILNLNHESTLSHYFQAMRQLEKPAKCCYVNNNNLDRNDFVKMLLLDGYFVLMSLFGTEWYTPDQQEPKNTIGRHNASGHMTNSNAVLNEKLDQDEERLEAIQSDTMQEDTYPIDQLYHLDLWHDFLLLENQIPFFVISKLYELVVGESSITRAVITERISEFVEDVLHCYPKAIQKHNRPKEFFHLLHLCHLYFRPRIAAHESYGSQANPSLFHNPLQSGYNLFSTYEARSTHEGQQATQQAIPSRQATEYQQAGIDFQKRKWCTEDPHSLLDIVFCNGIMEIPGLTIDPNTQSLFCNLLAFEQTCPQFGNCFTAYILFFCNLIRMPDDVSLLTKRGIIVHQQNSDAEVCDLFRMIMECAVFGSGCIGCNYLETLHSKIEAHYQSRRPVLRELLSSITSKVHWWTQTSESSESLMTTSQDVPV